MIDASIFFLSVNRHECLQFKQYGIVATPNVDFDAVFVNPLKKLCPSLHVHNLYAQCAQHGTNQANKNLTDLVDRMKPDYMLWPTMAYEFLPATLSHIRSSGTFVIGWFFDDEFRFDNYSVLWVPFLDFCFTNDPAAVKKYELLGVPALHVLTKANSEVFQKICIPKTYDVSFVGRNFGDRKIAIDYLIDQGIDVQPFGKGFRNGWVSVNEYVHIINQTKINLCFTKGCGEGENSQIKDKIFNITMSGGFLLCEYFQGMEREYEIGKEVECFTTLDDAVEKIEHYLGHDQERCDIANAGWLRAQKDHTQEASISRAFDQILINRKQFQNKFSFAPSATGFPELAARTASMYHLQWAKELIVEGKHFERVKEDVGMAIKYDPKNIMANYLKRLLDSPRYMDMLVMAILRGLLTLKINLSAIPLLRKCARLVKRFITRTRHLESRLLNLNAQDSHHDS